VTQVEGRKVGRADRVRATLEAAFEDFVNRYVERNKPSRLVDDPGPIKQV
jgi:hypothetical protein